jgi:hypothetical protein
MAAPRGAAANRAMEISERHIYRERQHCREML